MAKGNWKAKASYRFDNLMSRGLPALILILGLLSLGFIALVSIIVSVLGLYPPNQTLSFDEVLWGALLRTLDAGTMGQDQGTGYRIAMLVVTLGGVILVASLIGVISNAFNAKVQKLLKGRSQVIEHGHTLILGWNSKIFSVIHEIALANESREASCIVILADRDKSEMEYQIRSMVRGMGKTKLVIRSGDPVNPRDLAIVNPNEARSIVLLAPDGNEDADSVSLKMCLALVNGKNRKREPFRIVGEIKQARNLRAARSVGREEARWVLGDDLISHLIVQTSQHGGLSSVLTDFLDFEGNELYLHPAGSLGGKTFLESQLSFRLGCLIGLVRDGEAILNPAAAFQIHIDDQLVVIAEDDDSISVGESEMPPTDVLLAGKPSQRPPEFVLVLGNSILGRQIIEEMTWRLAPKSLITVLATNPNFGWEDEFDADPDVRVIFKQGDPIDQQVLEEMNIERFDHIVLLADRDDGSPQRADARTLLTLLHLRELILTSGSRPNIVSEMLDDHNRELAESTNADDFIVSDRLISLMLAQMEENPDLNLIFHELLTGRANQVRLHPAEWYVTLGVPVSFNQLIVAASNQRDTAVGVLLGRDANRLLETDQIVLNPSRTAEYIFQEGDSLVVLADLYTNH